MKANTFYFPHDYNARNDVKCLFLRQQLGMEGYGIFWFLIESLADSSGTLPLKIVPVLAMQMQVPDVKVLAVIKNFELFELTEDQFFSARLNTHLDLRRLMSEEGKKGAEKRWKNSPPKSPPKALPNSGGNAKEIKGKENKESAAHASLLDSNLYRQPTIPTFQQIYEIAVRQGGTKEMAEVFFNKHEAAGWFLNGSPIVNASALFSNFKRNWTGNNPQTTETGRKNTNSFV